MGVQALRWIYMDSRGLPGELVSKNPCPFGFYVWRMARRLHGCVLGGVLCNLMSLNPLATLECFLDTWVHWVHSSTWSPCFRRWASMCLVAPLFYPRLRAPTWHSPGSNRAKGYDWHRPVPGQCLCWFILRSSPLRSGYFSCTGTC